jgi:hypothetical protein
MPKMQAGIKGGFATPPQETAFEVYNLQKISMGSDRSHRSTFVRRAWCKPRRRSVFWKPARRRFQVARATSAVEHGPLSHGRLRLPVGVAQGVAGNPSRPHGEIDGTTLGGQWIKKQ